VPTEYAPGLPSRETSHELPQVKKPKVWEFGVHDHAAEKRGRHFDLRLGDPDTGHAHSWAMHTEWPKPGEKTWAIQQPTHTVPYMDFEGRIQEGYGKGDVKLFDRAKTEIMEASPGHINFNVYRGTGPEEYTLHRLTGKHWILMNRTPTREKHPHLPDSKPAYKEQVPERANLEHPDYIASAKIDDAHNLFYFPVAGEKIRIISYRPSKRTQGGLIEHTHKVPVFSEGLRVPEGLGGTILRGGLYAISPRTGKATEAHVLGSLLNANVWKSRENQKEHGELIPVLYDVVRYRGRDMEKAPYKEKLEVLRKVEGALPHAFHLPRMATTTEGKRKLIEDIQAGRIPETKEGVVLWNLRKPESPIKVKFTKDYDVYLRSFFPGEGKYKGNGVGGFYFSHEPEGPIAGRVGTGISDAQRRHMFQHPDLYRGMVARVKAQHLYESGALRAPAMLGWHLDKNEQQKLDLVKHAAVDFELCFLWERAID